MTAGDLAKYVGPYEIISPLGAGGMAQVHRARDTRLGRDVAVKVLSEESVREPAAIARFLREARAASALNHPNIVTIYDVGEIRGQHYIVMELVKGKTVRALIDEGSIPIEQLPGLAAQIARALDVAHAAGIVHRDIKPENIMAREDGYAKVLDFGIAHLPQTILDRPGAGSDERYVTRTGVLVGTPKYMSPEQIDGRELSGASDVFSLGVVLYEWATGRYPFLATSTIATLHAILTEEPIAPCRSNPAIPATLDALLLEMLQKEPARRPTAGEVAERLSGLGIRSDPPRVLRTRENRLTVGRGAERAAMRALLHEVAQRGRGVLIGVAGEAGIGKSMLVEDVVGELELDGEPWLVACGRCSERLAGTEAYLPFLEALEGLLTGDGRDIATRVMKVVAPSWFEQVGILTPASGAVEDVQPLSQKRLKRELLAFTTELSKLRPLVFWLEDLHWADASTLDLVAYLAAHFQTLRVAVVATYRPSELQLVDHPFLALRRELEGRGLARELTLDFLTEAEVREYLGLAFTNDRFPAALARLIHDKTEGNPLFMSDLTRDLRDRGVIVREGDRWTLSRDIDQFENDVPASMRSMVERKIDALSDEDRQLLVAASVQGVQFDTAIVARVLAGDAAAMEQRLDELERVHGFVRLAGEAPLPDGTPSSQYRFVHALYQNGLYRSLRAIRRAALSGAMARTLLAAHAREPSVIASELALLFEAAGDARSAAQQFLAASKRAAGLFADKEAIVLARRGLRALAATVDESPERLGLELHLQLALGLSNVRSRGYSVPEVEQAYTRARALCELLGEPQTLCPILQGLWRYYCVKGDLRKGTELADELLALTPQTGDEQLVAVAHVCAGTAWLQRGHFADARFHMDEALARYEPTQYQRVIAQTTDLKSASLSWRALALWHLGYPDRAKADHAAAAAHVNQLSDLFAKAFTLALGAWLYHYLREPRAAVQIADELLTLSTAREFGQWIPAGLVFRGWGLHELGQVQAGTAEMRKGLALAQSVHAEFNLPYFMGLLADALWRAGELDEAHALVNDALALAVKNDDRCWEPELHRFRATLLRADGAVAESDECLDRALESARRLGSKTLELRATVDLARRWRTTGRAHDAVSELSRIYGWFTEGLDTADLQDAETLLAELGASTTPYMRAPSGVR